MKLHNDKTADLCFYVPIGWQNSFVTKLNKNSFEPDLNQRPMDYWQCTTTVHRSTNWAIEGDIVYGELWKVMILIGLHNCPWELVYTHLSTWQCFTVSHITGGVAQMVERSLSMREVPGSIPGASITFYSFYGITFFRQKKRFASSGNRTRAARVAGEHSTTEPTMLHLKAHRNT